MLKYIDLVKYTPIYSGIDSPSVSLLADSQDNLVERENVTRDDGMWCRFIDSGGVYKLAFGPKAFIVVSDPVVVRHLLRVRSEELTLP